MKYQIIFQLLLNQKSIPFKSDDKISACNGESYMLCCVFCSAHTTCLTLHNSLLDQINIMSSQLTNLDGNLRKIVPTLEQYAAQFLMSV